MAKQRVAILGLGIMGSGMASRLLTSNFPVTVYNRNTAKTDPFAKAGAHVADSPRAAAQRSEVIISMVADDQASRDTWLGENGALNGAAPGSTLIESSTLTVPWIQELAAAAAHKSCNFLDAPVTGTKPHAESGELLFLVGGSASALANAQAVLSVLGRDVIHLGSNGSGALMKLINNFMAAVQAASFAEAVALITAGGLDREKAVSILTDGVPGSPMVKRVAARLASGDFSPNFSLRLMAKDLTYAASEGTRHKLDLQTPAAALAVFKEAINQGYGEEDLSAVVKSSRKLSAPQAR
ncbi:MAG: NAD(P)-dependent oxidoreductase [Acidobacteria bacterium]|nr:MAG: NAD(P)-dependent oxidoreductase [Acidobacteriota bacterium]